MCICIIFYQCDEYQQDYDVLKNNSQEEFLVSYDTAYKIAKNLRLDEFEESSSDKKTLTSFKYIKDNNTNFGNLFYIANYSNNSFVVISGDKRLIPILAFSTEGNFEFKKNRLPGGLIDWFNEAESNIVKARTNNKKQSKVTKLIWDYIFDTNKIPPPTGCNNETEIINPLLNTNWGQWHGYNNFAPNMNCNSVNSNAPSGCVATAMAQIIRYHEQPSNYNYSIMPNMRNATSPPWNSAGFNEISQLMRDAANSVVMDWGCDGSGADSEDIDNALRNNFGYSSARINNYISEIFKNEIRADRPVIFKGSTKNCFLGIFCWGEGGHAWVGDGFKRYFVCNDDPNSDVIGWGLLFLHMNWGWNSYGNGWFSSFKIGNNDYTYNKRIVHHIIP